MKLSEELGRLPRGQQIAAVVGVGMASMLVLCFGGLGTLGALAGPAPSKSPKSPTAKVGVVASPSEQLEILVTESPSPSPSPSESPSPSPMPTTEAPPPPPPVQTTTKAPPPPPAPQPAAPQPAAPPAPPPAAPTCGAPPNPYGFNFCGRGSNVYSAQLPGDVCSYFSCIGNFWNGKGYMEECNDGMYSMSGGIQGACSHHGGEQRAVLRG